MIYAILTAPHSPEVAEYVTKVELYQEIKELVKWIVTINLGFWALQSVTMAVIALFFKRKS